MQICLCAGSTRPLQFFRKGKIASLRQTVKDDQAFYVQSAAYDALVVTNQYGQPIRISASRFADRVRIPVLMVSQACMDNLTGISAENKQ